MGRFIDADKIIFREIDEIGGEYEPYLGCSKEHIDSLPTVDAIPRERIEQIKNEFIHIGEGTGWLDISLDDCLEIIDKYTKEQTGENT